MGIFTRVRDIVSSNLNAMLDKAEDPQKMIRLMIREIEDTLVETKASCAGVMAASKQVERELEQVRTSADKWEDRARLALEKGKEPLAREALVEKRRFLEKAEILKNEIAQNGDIIQKYREDISQLEAKLKSAQERQRVLVHRFNHAWDKRRAQEEILRATSSDTIMRFEQFEKKIDRMEAEAEIVNSRQGDLEDAFNNLQSDDEIEDELKQLKANSRKREV